MTLRYAERTGERIVEERNRKNQRVDVICQHSRDGSIIPLKIRIRDDDGEYQIYAIKGYKDVSGNGAYTMPNGIPGTSHTWMFECKIAVFSTERRIRLFYNAYENFWRMDYVG
ncbi:MAG: hypothetical protein MJ114_05935 [Acetatifactor sp.]|nr:hypothetical protein [Acetatifactor sp.]